MEVLCPCNLLHVRYELTFRSVKFVCVQFALFNIGVWIGFLSRPVDKTNKKKKISLAENNYLTNSNHSNKYKQMCLISNSNYPEKLTVTPQSCKNAPRMHLCFLENNCFEKRLLRPRQTVLCSPCALCGR